MATEGRARHLPGSRRLWIAAAVVLALGVAVRAVLPVVARGALERSLAEASRSRVTIEDVDLGLLRGALRLEGVAFRAAEPGGDGSGQAVVVGGPPPDGKPWLRAERFEVRIAWTALLGRSLRVRELALVRPELDVSRLEDGGLDLPPLRAEPDAPAEEEPEPSPGPGWTLAIDDAVLHEGRARFRDLTIAAEEPLELALDRIEVHDLAFRDHADHEPARIALEGEIEGAPLRADAELERVPAGAQTLGWTVTASLHAEGVPIRRVRFYLSPRYAPSQHWAELDGSLDLDLTYAYAPEGAHVVGGGGALRDVRVRVHDGADAGEERDVLAWRRLGVETRRIDLRARRAELASVALEGAHLLVETGPDAALPLLAGAPAPAAAPAAAPPPDPSPGPAWTGTLGEVRVRDAVVELVDAEGGSASWTLEASAEDVGMEDPFPVRVDLARDEAVIAAEGRVRAAPPGGRVELRVEGVAVRDLARHVAPATAGLLGAGTLGARLRLETAGEADAMRLEARGSLAVTGGRMQAEDPEDFALGWDELAADLESVVVPLGGGAPPRIALSRLRVVAPDLRVRRTGAGWRLPRLQEGPADEGAEPGPAPEVRIGALEISRAHLLLDDRAVAPFVRQEVDDGRASARDVRWPDLRAREIAVELPGLGSEPARITGEAGDEGLRLDVVASRVALPPFNPYVTRHSSYAIGSGEASLRADVRLAEEILDAGLDLTLHDLGLQDAADTFRKDFGVSLSLGMALLRDLRGDIRLSVPIRRSHAGVELDLFETIGTSLHTAVLNALVSPLKLAGAVVAAGGSVAAIEPVPVTFPPGGVEPTAAGKEQIGRIASLLASKPRLGLTLQPLVVSSDREALADVAAGPAPPGPGGFETPEALARARVDALRRVLREQYGVDEARIVSVAEPETAEEGDPRIVPGLAPLGETVGARKTQPSPEPET